MKVSENRILEQIELLNKIIATYKVLCGLGLPYFNSLEQVKLQKYYYINMYMAVEYEESSSIGVLVDKRAA